MRTTTLTLVALLAGLAGVSACERGPKPGEPVKITVTKRGYEPWKVQAKKDVPLTLVVTRTTDETCATELVLPEYGINQKLPLNEPVTITFTPKRTGELKYACAMNMFQGVIEVR
ncbi:cupredoxin domain-containing protein [Anaeromyxobacter terrae]|uniref:cupredoxin domain-containing protein n=1 Tax=Anaeromyxobacter terrae TaxID=2925406 RepID=UPI001F58ECAD|nr:cupredoxin domain-containing protein [Anaeromyxobacter sp. SG22]